MNKDSHFVALQNMYLAAPVNAFYQPVIDVSEARAVIEIDVAPELFHSGDARGYGPGPHTDTSP